MTTSRSQTTANPNGTFTLSESVKPVRAWRRGRWLALDSSLHRNLNGTVSPAVTTSPVALSGGGSGPLAVMSTAGRTLTLSWPAGPLPAPTLSGSTATYPNVLPGVDLTLTADVQGDVSDVLVVNSASAAANPALASIQFGASAPGLAVTADAGGNLRVAASATAQPVFTAPTPQMWDSAAPASGSTIVTDSDGTSVVTPGDVPAYSSAAEPGAAAHTAQIAVSVSGGTITLSPPASALTGPGIVYPVYIDPNFYPAVGNASHWHEVASYSTGSTNVNTGGDLQVGLCDFAYCDNGANWVARTLFDMSIPKVLRGAVIKDSNIWLTEQSAESCTASPVQLWATTNSDSSTWSNLPTHTDFIEQRDFAYLNIAGTSCPYFPKDATFGSSTTATGGTSPGELANWVSRDANHSPEITSQSFELQAQDEASDSQWKQFLRGTGDITMTTTYNLYPDKPTDLANAPGGACHTNASDEAQIGHDDVTLSATVGDQDKDPITAKITVYAYDTKQPVPGMPITFSTSGGTKSAPLSKTISRDTITSWQASGLTTAYRYYWNVTVDDGTTDPSQNPNSVSETCYFFYNPNNPPAPAVSASPSSTPIGSGSGLGTHLTFKPGNTNCSTSNTCPASYTYQLGNRPPVTVTPNNNPATYDYTSPSLVPIGQIGPVQLIVYDTTTQGNVSEDNVSVPVTGTFPSTPFPDGYFTNGAWPDVLETGWGKEPGLWLATGSGNGTVNQAVDIGTLGTSLNPGADGPGDWSTGDSTHPLQVLHGDFTGDQVQDVIAYYPAGQFAGDGVLLRGDGSSRPLLPFSGSTDNIGPQNWLDPSFGDGSTDDVPLDLVAAGNASQLGAAQADLIGILPNAAVNPTSYELVLYSTSGNSACLGGDAPGQYCAADQLSITPPGGSGDSWANYTLATAEPSSYPGHAGNPAATLLFAMNTVNGNLYLFKNPHCDDQDTSTCGTDTSGSSQLVGMSGSTKIPLTVPWGSSPPKAISADYNHAGALELWGFTAANRATAYTVSGTTVSPETGAGALVTQGSDDWQLTDGNAAALGGSANSGLDSQTGTAAALQGAVGTNYSWPYDGYFRTALQLDGSSYLTPPATTIPPGDNSPTISVWFRTTKADGVIAAIQSKVVSPGATISAGYDPVLYIGNDGKLYGDWWAGVTDPIASNNPVDDGIWHYASLTEANYDSGRVTETLTVDDWSFTLIYPGSVNLAGVSTTNTNLTLGAGYIGGGWPNEIYYKKSGNTGYVDYFNGQLAAIRFAQ